MCACCSSFVCSRCRGTWLADDYLDDPPLTPAEERESVLAVVPVLSEFVAGAR